MLRAALQAERVLLPAVRLPLAVSREVLLVLLQVDKLLPVAVSREVLRVVQLAVVLRAERLAKCPMPGQQ